VVLGEAVGSRHGRLATPRSPGDLSEGAAQAHAGGVVVKLGAVHLELPDRSQHQLVEQGGAVRVEEAVQCSPDPVVVEQFDITWPQPEGGRVVAGRPLSQGVHRLGWRQMLRMATPRARAGESRVRASPPPTAVCNHSLRARRWQK
jgi:hypothetical protein